ncbi:MAG: substrate-binding domain-containing protein [Bryobacteraceae bacterium]
MDHPLSGRADVLPEELLPYQILMPKSGTTRAKLNAWLEPVDDEIQVSMELDSTEMIKKFVFAGLGISFLAASHCKEEVALNRLSTASLGPEPMIRKLALIYRKDKGLSKAALGFIQVTIDHSSDADKSSEALLEAQESVTA